MKRVAKQRLDALDQKIREMTAIREALARLIQQCSGRGSLKGCPIIEGVLAQGASNSTED